MITSDRNTWPTGDKIWNVCQAIAIAEGYDHADSNPQRLNNPGDISDGGHLFPQEHHSGSNVTHFDKPATGWHWLYVKIEHATMGMSHVFIPTMTWTQIAQKWAGDWQNWVNNVTADLKVAPNSVFGDYFK